MPEIALPWIDGLLAGPSIAIACTQPPPVRFDIVLPETVRPAPVPLFVVTRRRLASCS